MTCAIQGTGMEEQIAALKEAVAENKEFAQMLDEWLKQLLGGEAGEGGGAPGGGAAGGGAPGGGAAGGGAPSGGAQPQAQQGGGAQTGGTQPQIQQAAASETGGAGECVCDDTAAAEGAGQTSGAGGEGGATEVDPANLPEAMQRLAPMINDAAAETGVPADMLAAMVWQESRGKSHAVTTNGGNGGADSGLMQINEATFAELQANHPELQGMDPGDDATNILAAAYFMKDLEGQFGSWDLALRGYNSGPGSVDTSDANVTTTGLGDPTYVEKVLDFADRITNGQELPA